MNDSKRNPNPAVVNALAIGVSRAMNIELEICQSEIEKLISDGLITVSMSGQKAVNILKAKLSIDVAKQEFERLIPPQAMHSRAYSCVQEQQMNEESEAINDAILYINDSPIKDEWIEIFLEAVGWPTPDQDPAPDQGQDQSQTKLAKENDHE